MNVSTAARCDVTLSREHSRTAVPTICYPPLLVLKGQVCEKPPSASPYSPVPDSEFRVDPNVTFNVFYILNMPQIVQNISFVE